MLMIVHRSFSRAARCAVALGLVALAPSTQAASHKRPASPPDLPALRAVRIVDFTVSHVTDTRLREGEATRLVVEVSNPNDVPVKDISVSCARDGGQLFSQRVELPARATLPVVFDDGTALAASPCNGITYRVSLAGPAVDPRTRSASVWPACVFRTNFAADGADRPSDRFIDAKPGTAYVESVEVRTRPQCGSPLQLALAVRNDTPLTAHGLRVRLGAAAVTPPFDLPPRSRRDGLTLGPPSDTLAGPWIVVLEDPAATLRGAITRGGPTVSVIRACAFAANLAP